jgi:hypothetical protein
MPSTDRTVAPKQIRTLAKEGLMPRNPLPFNTARITRRLSVLAGALAALGAVALPAQSAQAALQLLPSATPLTTTACEAGATSEVFLPWGDTNQYGLLAGGNFEGLLLGWTLTGGARTVLGSEPFNAAGPLGLFSMGLPAGSSVTTPLTCVDAGTPTFRFFARNLSQNANILVQVVYTPPGATSPIVVAVGDVSGNTAWAPTRAMVTGGTILSAKTGNAAEVSLRFTAYGGPSQIDDIFVDPRHAK